MKISRPLAAVAIAAIIGAAAMTACIIGPQSPTPVPTATPIPPVARDFYKSIETIATKQPARLEKLLKEKPYRNFKGKVTDTESGKIQFHIGPRPDFSYDTYINCDMRNKPDAERVSVGQVVVMRGRLKDAFNQGGWFGSLKGFKNENLIELKDCVILAR